MVCDAGVIDMLKSPMLKAADSVFETTPSVKFTVKGYCPIAIPDWVATVTDTAIWPPGGRLAGFGKIWQAAPVGNPWHDIVICVAYAPTLAIKSP